jgi:hypothetical protein
VNGGFNGYKASVKNPEPKPIPTLTIEEAAKKVIAGEFSNGSATERKLSRRLAFPTRKSRPGLIRFYAIVQSPSINLPGRSWRANGEMAMIERNVLQMPDMIMMLSRRK